MLAKQWRTPKLRVVRVAPAVLLVSLHQAKCWTQALLQWVVTCIAASGALAQETLQQSTLVILSECPAATAPPAIRHDTSVCAGNQSFFNDNYADIDIGCNGRYLASRNLDWVGLQSIMHDVSFPRTESAIKMELTHCFNACQADWGKVYIERGMLQSVFESRHDKATIRVMLVKRQLHTRRVTPCRSDSGLHCRL